MESRVVSDRGRGLYTVFTIEVLCIYQVEVVIYNRSYLQLTDSTIKLKVSVMFNLIMHFFNRIAPEEV